MEYSHVKHDLTLAYNLMARERDLQTKEEWKLKERDEFAHCLRDDHDVQLLDIGAGTGQDSVFFQEHGYDVTCIDLSPEMVARCQGKGLRAHEMDFSNLQFANSSFDAVWALNCLLHVPKCDIDVVLLEVQRVLRPGGLFYMGVYGRNNSEGVWENDNYVPKRFFSFFDNESLRSLLAKYFQILQFRTLPHSEHLDFQSVMLKK